MSSKIKKAVKIKSLVNWFYGNYCTRKCYNNIGRQREHFEKLQKLADNLDGLEMTHKDFLHMLRSDRVICNLSDEEWKNAKFSWSRNNCMLCRKLGIK